ncbi:MAG: hypothetical protein HC804_08570 [Anaerolineae bacterium]|nr:hypothetical protein [Anaerolineae bacterium]
MSSLILTAVTLFTILTGTLLVAYANDGLGWAQSTVVATKVISSTAEGVQFQVDIPTYQVGADGQVQVPGLSARQSAPGAPDLPYYTTYIALPADAEVSVQVQAQKVVETQLETVWPAPELLFEQADGVGALAAPQEILRADEAVYGRDALFPETLYTVSAPMHNRDMRLVALQVYPCVTIPSPGRCGRHKN